jgi:hypothetical protein
MRANIAIACNEIGSLAVHLHRYPEALAASDEALIYLVDGSKRERRDAIATGQRRTKRWAI